MSFTCGKCGLDMSAEEAVAHPVDCHKNTPKIMTEKLKALRERAQLADRLVCDLASGKKKWNMCVPPQSDDTDMILITPVREDIPTLLAMVEAAKEALEFYAAGGSLNASTHECGDIYIWEGGGTDRAGTQARSALDRLSSLASSCDEGTGGA